MGDPVPVGGVECASLGPSEAWAVGPLRAECREDVAVLVDLEVARADVGQPADRLEADRPGVAQDDEPAEPAGRPMDDRLAAVGADPVGDPEPAAPDADAEAVAGEDEDPAGRDEVGWPGARRRPRLGAHAEQPPCATPPGC